MSWHSAETRLSQIVTNWSLIHQAHHGAEDDAHTARGAFLHRYGGAAFHYLRGIVCDADAADDLFQDFALRFLRGDFQAVQPTNGRFRDFLKIVLRHMAIDYRRRDPKSRPGEVEFHEAALPCANDAEAHFEKTWRDELLGRTWRRLEEDAERSQQPLYEALRARAEHPDLRYQELAAYLAGHLGRLLSVAGLRQVLHRARKRFADFLLDEIAASLAEPSVERVQDELMDIGLLPYCVPALARRVACQTDSVCGPANCMARNISRALA